MVYIVILSASNIDDQILRVFESEKLAETYISGYIENNNSNVMSSTILIRTDFKIEEHELIKEL